jgi:hypothetical protein
MKTEKRKEGPKTGLEALEKWGIDGHKSSELFY